MSKWMDKLYNSCKTKMKRSSMNSNTDTSEENNNSSVIDKSEGEVAKEVDIVNGSQPGQWCAFVCRSIRVGNYKVLPKEKITITEKGLQIKVPAINTDLEIITINIEMKDVLKVLVHFGKSMPLLFLYVSPTACQKTRKLLKMTNSQGYYLDVQSQDETQKRITVLPEKLTEDNKAILKKHFGSNMQELESKDANEILVRSSPKDQTLKAKMVGLAAANGTERGRAGDTVQQESVKYCQFPPDGAGIVSVTNEDYNCLEAEQFLNDVIIDFYLKYLQHGKYKSIEALMERTHIFTTYFYKRLTTRPTTKGKVDPVESDPSKSAAEKRYHRVERWTKKVNLFEKDFIIVPINEHAHWFVCVICFPGQEGCVRYDTGERCEPPASQARTAAGQARPRRKQVKKPMTIGSTTIIPLKGRQGGEGIRYALEDEISDRDEAEASEDDMDDEEEDVNGFKEDDAAEKFALKQPCILIFDSLKGSSKHRTLQTLREYLTCEWRKKQVTSGREDRVFTKQNMLGMQPTVRQQPNFSDCGIYLLQYVESFFRDPINDYTHPIKSVSEWFTEDEVEEKRSEIAKLIQKLSKEQNPEKEFQFPQLNFVNPPVEGEESEEDEDDDEYEDGSGAGRGPVQRVGASQLVRVSGSGPGTPGRTVVVTPAKQQGKVLIQRTSGQLKMSPYTSSVPSVPAGVTVTPATTRILQHGNNISIRKMSSAVSSSSGGGGGGSESVQTSPDSTSQEADMADTPAPGPAREDGGVAPDSQSFEPGPSKRSANGDSCEEGVKRAKSDTD